MKLGDPIAIGNTAKVYLYENKIFKVFNDYFPDTESANEAYKQKYAYSCGLPVPEVLDVTKIDGKQVIVMEYRKGRTVGEILTTNMEHVEYYLNISVEIQQKIHRIDTTSIESMTEKLIRQIESVPSLDNSLKFALIEKMKSIVFEDRLCHGDFHLFNLIMSDNNVTIIDWVDSSAGDLRADVYRTYLLYSQASVELADLYISLYCKKSGLTKAEIFQWAPIIAAARLSESISSENEKHLMEIVYQYSPS